MYISQDTEAAVAQLVRVSDHGRHVTGGFEPEKLPLKTFRVGQRCMLNLAPELKRLRWCGSWERGASSGYRPLHFMTMVQKLHGPSPKETLVAQLNARVAIKYSSFTHRTQFFLKAAQCIEKGQ
ncbi:hypothetical protein TNCV_2111601 [Trichonephila clavipes]|nr:hypothetical protein TNCV_2111601 [Trichonephila clavipes]